jgi:hypothetical protein
MNESGFMRKVAGQLEVLGWRRLDRQWDITNYPSVCTTWHQLGVPVDAISSHSEALSGYAVRDARIAELEDELEGNLVAGGKRVKELRLQVITLEVSYTNAKHHIAGLERKFKSARETESGTMNQLRAELDRSRAFLSRVDAENSMLGAELAELKAAPPVRIATKISIPTEAMAQELQLHYLKGYKAAEAKYTAQATAVVMPERRTKTDYSCYIGEFASEAAAIHNAALDEVARLNAVKS